MAEISPQSLVPRADGPVAALFLMAPRAGGRTAALKVYPRPLDRRTYHGIEVEQAKLAELRTVRSILTVDALEELTDGRTGLRTEFCPQSLRELVARGPLPIRDVVTLGQILASVLAEAHPLGLVHGGITPANVLERPDGQPVLGDFGLTLRLRFPRDLTAVAGYTAPEVLRDGELSEQSDVYGLGAVLYFALTGHAPFSPRTGENAGDVVLRVLRDPVPDVTGRDVPRDLIELLRRMMAKEPADRPDAAEVVRVLEYLLTAVDARGDDKEHDFDDFSDEVAAVRTMDHGPSPAPRPVARVAPPAPQRSRPKIPKELLIGAGAAASVLAVLVVMVWPSAGDDPDSGTAPQVPAASSSEPARPEQTPTSPGPTVTPAVQLVLQPPQDKGTSVVLKWTSSKPLTYALNIAQQGGSGAQTTYRGSGTSQTVQVVPGLKYCFEVQGTDGTAIYISEPQPLRGATCRRR
ncbi:serine/threonine protein kinase [Kribbella amoyensis]|nr:serine/threonine-protein kinase [Kribbella amoyensis]